MQFLQELHVTHGPLPTLVELAKLNAIYELLPFGEGGIVASPFIESIENPFAIPN